MRWLRQLLSKALPAAFVFTAAAMFTHPLPAPVDRLLANEKRYVETHPSDPIGYYTLGRIHYLAFSLMADELPAEEIPKSSVEVNLDRPGRHAEAPKEVAEAAKKKWTEHVQEAVRLLKMAIVLDQRSALYELGIGCIYEDGKSAAGDNWQDDAIQHYLAAYTLSEGKDHENTHYPIAGLASLVSYEAGQSYLRIIRARGIKDSEVSGAKAIEDRIREMQHLPRGPITPIVISLKPARQLADLLSARQVTFDLDGTGRPQRYQWLAPDAVLLVWDPQHIGRVHSGRDLFGSVTWWIFWRNGYEAMAALDDNHNGWLEGPELNGLALWFDRNGNGVSDPGEVIPIEQTEISALAVESDAFDGGAAMALSGVRMKDGRSLPSWDWIPERARLTLSSVR